jgi:hypothetical protein
MCFSACSSMTTSRSRAGSPRSTPFGRRRQRRQGRCAKRQCSWRHCPTIASARPRASTLRSALPWRPGTSSACRRPTHCPSRTPSSQQGGAGRPSRRIWPRLLEVLSLPQERDCWRLLKRPDAKARDWGPAMSAWPSLTPGRLDAVPRPQLVRLTSVRDRRGGFAAPWTDKPIWALAVPVTGASALWCCSTGPPSRKTHLARVNMTSCSSPVTICVWGTVHGNEPAGGGRCSDRPDSRKPILVRHAYRRLSGRGEAGEILYLRAKLTLSSPSIRRANKDELPSIAGFLVDNSFGTGDRA